MFVIQKVHYQFKARGGRAVKMAAALCVAGVVAGIAGGVALAQVGGGNPTPNTETVNIQCCESVAGCPQPCQNYGPGTPLNQGASTDVIASGPGWTTCGEEQAPSGTTNVPCQAAPASTCGTIQVFSKANCQGNPFNPTLIQEPNCGNAPGC